MGWSEFVEQFRTFWNQPVPIIGFTVGAVIVAGLVFFSKTSLGKKALNKIKSINDSLRDEVVLLKVQLIAAKDDLVNLGKTLEVKYEKYKLAAEKVIESKDIEIQELTEKYETKVKAYKDKLLAQGEMIKVICENSVNKKIKEAYEKYCELEDVIYGEEEKDTETTSE